MALTKGAAAPTPGATAHPAAPAELKDTTTAPAAVADIDHEFDPTPSAAVPVAQAIPAATGTAVASAQPPKAGALSILDGVRNEAFSSLDNQLRFGSFPTIKLDKDKFIIVDGKEEVDEFTCHILVVRPKWIYKTATGNEQGEMFYSYDKLYDTKGKPIEDIIKEWKADGLSVKEVREYSEVAAIMKDTSLKDEMVLLSVPPASVGRLAGFRTQLNVMKKVDLDKVLVRCCKGGKVTTKDKKTFYPWDFKFAGAAEV